MNIVIVFAIPCYMASLVRCAPLPEGSTLVEDPQFQEILLRSRSLVQKILLSIPDTHKSCIYTEGLQLNSSENAKLATMATIINIPPAPALRAVSESVTLKTSLTQMSEGLHLHQDLLNSVSQKLQSKDKVTELMTDIRDLTIQVNKMLKMVQKEAVVQPSPTPVALNLPGEYEVQVAAHLTLVQLQSFGQDAVRLLRSLDQSEETEN